MVELRKRQASSDVSARALTVELEAVKAQLIQMAAEKPELSMNLNAMASNSDRRLEKLPGLRGARDRVKGLLRCIVDQSIRALDVIANQVGV